MKHISHPKVRESIFKKYDGKCSYCGSEITLTNFSIDHIVPLRRHINEQKNHLNVIENYNPCCKSCNSSKGSMTIETWRKEIELKKERIFRDSSAARLLKRMGLMSISKLPITFYFEMNNG